MWRIVAKHVMTGNEIREYDRTRGYAEQLFDTFLTGDTRNAWVSVRLEYYGDNGNWVTVKSGTPDWHSSPVTHSYA